MESSFMQTIILPCFSMRCAYTQNDCSEDFTWESCFQYFVIILSRRYQA